jgi:hypothetical protein
MWMWIWDEAVWVLQFAVAEREPHDLGQCSHSYVGSLGNNDIGDEGAQYLGAALQVNSTLTELK